MDAAGELDKVKFLWYDIPDPRLQKLMFKTLGFEFDMNKSNPMRDMSMALKRFQAQAKNEKIDEFWEARQGFLGMQKMVGAAPMMAKLMKKPVFKSLVMIGYWNNRSVENVENMFLYLMKHFMNGAYAGDVPLPRKGRERRHLPPGAPGAVPNARRVPGLVRAVVRARSTARSPGSASASSPTTSSCPIGTSRCSTRRSPSGRSAASASSAR